MPELSYNQRLFGGGGLRAYLHTGRFRWVRRQLGDRLGADYSLLEVGCYDGKLLEWLPRPPARYTGVDANWEGGLDLALQRYSDQEQLSFVRAEHPREVTLGDERFDIGVSLETLEHLPAGLMCDYLDLLAARVGRLVLISVPVEIGPVFALKWLAKKLFMGGAEPYTPAEFLWAMAGRVERVERVEHKGFDYRLLLTELQSRFELESVDAIPLSWLPPYLSFGVGIVARPRAA